MNDELREAAKKKVEAKKAFYTTATVFSGTALVLMILSLAIPAIAFWVFIPLPVLAMVLGVLYINAFGFPGTNSDAEDWEEEEIQKEMRKLERRRLPNRATDAVNADTGGLELKELERLARPSEDDFV